MKSDKGKRQGALEDPGLTETKMAPTKLRVSEEHKTLVSLWRSRARG